MPARLLKYLLARISGRVTALPILVLMPHSRCNCRCVMCDIWKANQDKREITTEDLAPHIETFRRFGVKWFVLSGGEPLMHSNLWSLCERLKGLGARITLLSTGLLLERHARQICALCDEVIISLDGSREIHNRIRNIPRAYESLEEGVRALKAIKPAFPVKGRSVIQRQNYRDLLNIVEAARAIGLDQISFLAVDVSSSAFNRPEPWADARVSGIALNEEEVQRFGILIDRLVEVHAADIRSGFIAESANKLRRLPAYFSAVRGLGGFPQNRCNAPWVSAVVEADGTVRPCFFHRALGNIHREKLDAILNSNEAVSFRKSLDVQVDPICKRCVCTLHLNPLAEM